MFINFLSKMFKAIFFLSYHKNRLEADYFEQNYHIERTIKGKTV